MEKINTEDRQMLIKYLEGVKRFPPGSSLKTKGMSEIITWMEKRAFHRFTANNGPSYPGIVGEYLEISLPPNKQGHLKQFAGQHVIVVCIGSGRYRTREYMAGQIQESQSCLPAG